MEENNTPCDKAKKNYAETKEKIHKILSKIISISTLVFFACCFFFSLGDYLRDVDVLSGGRANIIAAFSLFDKFFARGDASTVDGQIHSITGPYQGVYLVLSIIFFYVSVVTLSILGIVKEASNLGRDARVAKNPYLMLLLLTAAISYVLMANGFALGGNPVSIGAGLCAILVLGGILFLLRLANSLVFSFVKGKGLVLASNIVAGVLIIQFLLLIGNAAKGYLHLASSTNEVGTYGFVSILSYLESALSNVASLDFPGAEIHFVLALGVIFATIECLLVVGFVLCSFFAVKALLKDGVSASPIVFSSIACLLSLIYLSLGVAESLVLGSLNLGNSFNVCSGLVSLFIGSVFFLGGSIAGYILKKKSLETSK